MPRVPRGRGKQLFGIGIFVPTEPVPDAVGPSFAPAGPGPWPESFQPPRINYSWVLPTQATLTDTRIFVPASAGPWPESIQPLRVNYGFVQGTNILLLAPAVEQLPVGESIQQLAIPVTYPRTLRTWVWSRLLEEPIPIGEAATGLIARPEWPRSLRTWIQEPFYEEQAPIGSIVQALVTRPEYPRSLRTWLQTQLFEEGMPVGESTPWLVLRPEWPRNLRTWTQAQLLEEPMPVGGAIQRIALPPEFLRSLRTWVQWQQLQEVVVEAPPVGESIQQLALQPPRPNYSWVFWLPPVSRVLMPGQAGTFYDFRVQRPNYSWTWTQQLQEVVVEQPPIGEAVQNLVRWPDYPLNLRSRVQVQLLEEPLPIGEAVQVLAPRPEWPRQLRTWLQWQLFEEQIPSFQISWARPPQAARKDYWFAQSTSVVLTQVVEAPPPVSGDWPKIRRFRLDYGSVQPSDISLLSSIVEQPPIGESVQALVRWIEYPLRLRTQTRSQQLEEQMPVGEATMQRLRDPEYLRSLRSRAQTQLFEEGMPVGETVQQRLRDPEYLRSLRTWSAIQLFEEQMPPKFGEWQRIIRGRGTYNWVQATNIALLTGVAVPSIRNDWILAQRPRRSDYNWVQSTNIALLTAAVVAPPIRNDMPLVPRPIWEASSFSLPNLAIGTPVVIVPIPAGKAIFQRVRDPDTLWYQRSRSDSRGATAPIIPPFVPPPAAPIGKYRALADLYLPDGRYIEADTIFFGPSGWIPAVAVDPLDDNAIQAYWDLGPVTMKDAEVSEALFPFGLWDRRKGQITPPEVYWKPAFGQPSGVFILTGNGSPLGPKVAP